MSFSMGNGNSNPTLTYSVLFQEPSDIVSIQELKNSLENGSEATRITTMKQLLTLMANGEDCSQLLMSVIRFIMPSGGGKGKILKKLLLMFLEMCPKINSDGKLKQEMILVCNGLRNDLQHPNEYVRGCTLRFLGKIKEIEILSPLLPSLKQCLEHKNPYVRKNAIHALRLIYRNSPSLIPDAPLLLCRLLEKEHDAICRRNAFSALTFIDVEKARILFNSWLDEFVGFDGEVQLAILEYIRKDAKINYNDKAKYVKSVLLLVVEGKNRVVRYEAANLLVVLSNTPSVVRASLDCLIELASKESNLNVKMILMDRIKDINVEFSGVCSDISLDVLKILNCSNIDVKKKCVSIVLSVASSKYFEEIVSLLKKDLIRLKDLIPEKEKGDDYALFLMDSLSFCMKNNGEFIGKVIPVFISLLSMDDVTSSNGKADVAYQALLLLRDCLVRDISFKSQIFDGIISNFINLPTKVLQEAIWILGEFATTQHEIKQIFLSIKEHLGDLPLIAAEQRLQEALKVPEGEEFAFASSSSNDTKQQSSLGRKESMDLFSRPRVLPDGTYASESALSALHSPTLSIVSSINGELTRRPLFRKLFIEGHHCIATAISNALVKFYLKLDRQSVLTDDHFRGECMLIVVSITRFCISSFVSSPMDKSSFDKMLFNLNVLGGRGTEMVGQIILENPKKLAFRPQLKGATSFLSLPSFSTGSAINIGNKANPPDSSIEFRFLKESSAAVLAATLSNSHEDDEIEEAILLAVNGNRNNDGGLKSKLSKVAQFTGYSDVIYAEAYVTVRQYDILLDVLVVNQTKETIQNVSFELVAMGDLKLVEKPKIVNLAPFGYQSVKASLKVTSTENAVIFGNIVYDKYGTCDASIISLNDLKIDVVDYIQPAICTEAEFRQMYLKFEWENKIAIRATSTSLKVYLEYLLKQTHFNSITRLDAFADDAAFISACLYAKSVFGEDVVANISLETNPTTKIVSGHLRLRAKATGIAYSLGEKVSSLLCNVK